MNRQLLSTVILSALTIGHANAQAILRGPIDGYGIEQPPPDYARTTPPPHTIEIILDFKTVDLVCGGTGFRRYTENACFRRGLLATLILANMRDMPKDKHDMLLALAKDDFEINVVVLPELSFPGMSAARQQSLRTHEWGHYCLDHLTATSSNGWVVATDAPKDCKRKPIYD